MRFNQAGALQRVDIRAVVVGDGFPTTPILNAQWVNSNNGSYNYSGQASIKFPNKVQTYSPLTIIWEASLTGTGSWKFAGSTQNIVYLLYHQPTKGAQMYQTVVAYGSVGAAKDTPSAVLAGIWSNFKDKTAKRVSDGTSLYYYRTWARQIGKKQVFAPPVSLAGLLETRDGQCTAWSQLLYNAILAQGLPQDATGIGPVQMMMIQANLTPPTEPNAPPPPKKTQLGLMVGTWIFGAENNEGTYLWKNQANRLMQQSPGVKTKIMTAVPINVLYQWYDFAGTPAVSYGGVNDGTVLLAQNNPNPLATFENHVVVEINGKYYDPSYGARYDTLPDMQNRAIAGFYNIQTLTSTNTMLILKGPNPYLYEQPYNP